MIKKIRMAIAFPFAALGLIFFFIGEVISGESHLF